MLLRSLLISALAASVSAQPSGNSESCPVVEPEGICPSTKPADGESCNVGEGTVCRYDFELLGCNPDELECTPLSVFDCQNGIWVKGASNPIRCLNSGLPCPKTKPENSFPCLDHDSGLKCEYDFVNRSCEEGGEICAPIETFVCAGTVWASAVSNYFCNDPNAVPSHFLDPCDPNEKCPSIKPENRAPCPQQGLSCDYEYANTSCEEGGEKCSPTEFYSCGPDGWMVAMPGFFCENANFPSHFLDACDPNNPNPNPNPNKPCPEVKPENGAPCVQAGHQEGLSCNYEYANTSCEEGEEKCSPTEFYSCSADGWRVAMPYYFCENANFPSHFLDACDPNNPKPPPNPNKPCPEVKPENGAPCLEDGHQEGLSCDYEYRNTSCEEGEEKCSPTEFYSCSADGWMVAMPDFFCETFPSNFLDTCDPNNKPCPTVKPENGAPCVQAGHQPGLSCDYEYANTSCEEGDWRCSPTEFYTCFEEGWAVALPNYFCDNANFPSHFLDACDPNNKPCPKTKPENGASCVEDGHQEGLSCDYEYRNTSCEEGEENCTPTELYSCSADGWRVAMPGFFCETFPSHMLEACDPNKKECPEMKPENGAPCTEEGMSCDYEYRNTSCDESTESCNPTEFFTCGGGRWNLAMPRLGCPDGVPTNFLDTCDPSASSASSEAGAASDASEDLTRDPGSVSSAQEASSGAVTLQRASQNGHWIVGAAILVTGLLN